MLPLLLLCVAVLGRSKEAGGLCCPAMAMAAAWADRAANGREVTSFGLDATMPIEIITREVVAQLPDNSNYYP